jgi:hypothetical protein
LGISRAHDQVFRNRHAYFCPCVFGSELDLNRQSDWLLYWESFEHLQPHKSGKTVVCGHTPATLRAGQERWVCLLH